MNDYLKIALSVCITATLVVSAVIIMAVSLGTEDEVLGDDVLESFSSKNELRDFIESSESLNDRSSLYYGSLAPDSSTFDSDLTESSYSETNVQVAGIDEADIVKTDGEFIYVASYRTVSIVKASPPSEMVNVSMIDLTELMATPWENRSGYISGIFLSNDRLIVIWNMYFDLSIRLDYADDAEAVYMTYFSQAAMVSVFDISDIQNPSLDISCGISGYSMTSRMIGDDLYLVSQIGAWTVGDEPLVPFIWSDGSYSEMDVDDILFDPETPDANSYICLLSLDVVSGAQQSKAIIAGYASTIYMSAEALYLTIPKWTGTLLALDIAIDPVVEETARTSIYKISIDGLSMTVSASGKVIGWLLDQFSMDEYDGYLRVATTTSWSDPENAVYVLDPDLNLVGAIEHIAPDERIYSSRFLGDTLYLVTFLQVDPLFVIDLSNPEQPEIVGELKIPGFSSYLHPVDDGYVLGIGSENGSVKVTLFDVTDPESPVEQSTFLIGSYSWTDAMYDHKAVLFDLEHELLVIPVSVSVYDAEHDYSYWTGIYVFNISVTDGISLRGTVENDDVDTYDSVIRSLYIEDTLYSISHHTIKAVSLDDLSYEGLLVYSPEYYYYVVYPDGVLS